MKITNAMFKTILFSTALLSGQANAAALIDPEVQPLGHLGPLELDTTDLSNGAKSYRGWFENGAWQGDLIEYDVSNTGALTTSIDLTDISPKQSAGGTNWSAHVYFSENSGVGENLHWDTGRKIITSTTGTNQVAFRWANLTSTQKELIDSVAFGANDTSSDILDFLRGDRSNEKPAGELRQRYSVLSDIVHSNPEYMAAPEGEFTDPSYIAYKNANTGRAPRIYVGANGGMLHAFDASNGREIWAYVPSMIMHKMSRLAGIPYAHTYFVDGSITVVDAFYGGDWRTVLVGSLGAGAKGLYALDVTSPDLSSENISAGDDKKVLWELSADGDDDIGYIFDATTITQLNDGKWYAVNGNGISSVNGIAKLILVEIETGAVTVISTGAGSAGSPNGLAAPALVDTDNDGKADIAFAGDIDGDMWKFDLTSSSSASWKLDYKLYDGSSGQPITLAPDVANHPQFGHLVLFGTGKLYESADITDKTIQSIYGIWDKGVSPTGFEARLAQLLSADTIYTGGGYTETVRTFTTVAAIDYAVYSGWKVDLPAGERLLTPPQLRASRLKTTITDPDGFENWLLEVTFDEGGVNDESIFDLDRDAKLNTADRVDGNVDTDFDDLEDIPMAWQRPDGNMSQVTIGSLGAGIDTLFLNFLNPPIVPPTCSGICSGGLSGGHMDVDTDSSILGGGHGGGTDGHVHEYDDKTDRTYIDYLDIFPEGGSKLRNITEVDIDPAEDFIVLIANADWSPGGTLVLNGISYNVVEYQRMIHKALADWDGNSNTLKDPVGNSLVLDLNDLSPGEFQMNFDSTAIIGGGLLPTNTGCVNKTNSITKGRWRNGALILQVIKASHFDGLGGDSALDRVTVQTPEDLKDVVVLSDGTQVELIEDLNGDTVIDGTSPAYEMYGGIHATGDDDEFLYESSVFWHWDEVECYGDPDWEEVFSLVTEGVPAEVYQEMLEEAGFVDFEALAARVAELESCTDKKTCGDEIRELRDLIDLYEQGLIVEANKDEDGDGVPDGGGDGGGGGGLSGTPQVIEGGVSEGGMTSGPNFETGRRTWIDIVPE
jgi:hypothetical protein